MAAVTPRSPQRSAHRTGPRHADSSSPFSHSADLAGPAEYAAGVGVEHERPLDDLLGQVTALLSQVHDILG